MNRDGDQRRLQINRILGPPPADGEIVLLPTPLTSDAKGTGQKYPFGWKEDGTPREQLMIQLRDIAILLYYLNNPEEQP